MTFGFIIFCLALQFASHGAPRLRPSVFCKLIDVANALKGFADICHAGVDEAQDMLGDRIGQYIAAEFDF